jgi:hypothetical protein
MLGRTQEALAITFLDRWIGGDAETRIAADADLEPASWARAASTPARITVSPHSSVIPRI